MDNPKVSVLIPLYNRKQYAAACINSVLKQTFQDFEIVIRDDRSTDGVYEFVQENYAEQISSGKIRLLQNAENLGEGANMNRIFRDAKGKYLQVLHNDDLLVNTALEYLYETAEKYGADVVHSTSLLSSPPDGVIATGTKLRLVRPEPTQIKEITIVSDKPTDRFNQWINEETFHDVQFNFFRRDFILENELPYDTYEAESLFFALWWIMLAKVFIKTPVPYYVKRNSPYNQTNERKRPPEYIEKFITNKIEQSRDLDKLFRKVELFRDNEYLQYMIKAHIFKLRDNGYIFHDKVYKDGITPEFYQAAARAFKKYFGDDYLYPLFLFNWVHVMPYNRKVDVINFGNTPTPTQPK